uniref:Cas12f1-like TNB domain-containing protein n=1 Tax=Globisporangium ultimum (strain ATCC 200006 / CBS 805.95 / DAOM BR144) TaxID=431595 RepID=K3WA73_GLOUD
MKYELRQQMVANAGVMLREHFRRRLCAYVKVVYPNAKEKDVLHGCYNSEPTKLEEVQEMRALLTPDGVSWCEEWIPWPNRITDDSKIEFYIRLLWKFQRVIEDHIEANPGRSTKGVRAFSLFPVATSYTASHIKINATTLAGLCSRVKKKDPETGGDCSITKWWGVDHIKIDHNAFAAEKWTVMRKAFDIDAFETLRPDTDVSQADFRHMTVEEKYAHASHLFANQVTTDGYGASVLLFRTKNELDEAEKQQSERLVPEGYRPEVVIGLDPGMRSVCTAVRERFVPGQIKRVRRRSVRKKRRRKRSWIRRYDGPKRKNGRDIVEVHAKEYRHLAGFRKRRTWEEVLKNSNPEYGTAIRGMPSFKTSRYKVYLERLHYFWKHAGFLLEICWRKPFLKWKFFNKRSSRIAVDALAARIVPDPSVQTCIAYGNWSRRDGIKGHASSPVKSLQQALAKRAKVVILDEFKTSKLCSTCHRELSPVSYLVNPDLDKRRKRAGKIISRYHSEERKLVECHAVLRCDQKKCEASYWNRDVNAAINIVNLLKYEIEHGGRMAAFARVQDRRD